MRLRFTRCVPLIPGLRLNASRGGLSLSIGHRGACYTTGRAPAAVDSPRADEPGIGLKG